MQTELEASFLRHCPAPSIGFFSLRWVHERSERLSLQNGVLLPVEQGDDVGMMVTAYVGGAVGYAASQTLTEQGVVRAIERARHWAERTSRLSVLAGASPKMSHPQGEYRTAVRRRWEDEPLSAKLDLLREASERLHSHDEIVSWDAELWFLRWHCRYVTNGGGRSEQLVDLLCPNLVATAHKDGETQTRSLRDGWARQGGLEVLDDVGFLASASELAEQCRELVAAPNCPSGRTDLVLASDQMVLQIHESIGHPIELDRILGDERNYAGGSFVTLDMFGTYQYGSELLEVSFDPSEPGELASLGFDDDGQPATRVRLIERGLLVAPLGGTVSQARAAACHPRPLPSNASARASSWNRPPIDRMANLNLEPGASSLQELVAGIERGVYMETNRSWSIDDSRNKFQFGCERARLIEHGRLTTVVKNPSYRGVSATFWRSLDGVGNAATRGVHGTPYCGKGEPNQVIRVGHATPACRFRDVEVFGGE